MSQFYNLLIDSLETLDSIENTDESSREQLLDLKSHFDLQNDQLTEYLTYIASDLKKSTNL